MGIMFLFLIHRKTLLAISTLDDTLGTVVKVGPNLQLVPCETTGLGTLMLRCIHFHQHHVHGIGVLYFKATRTTGLLTVQAFLRDFSVGWFSIQSQKAMSTRSAGNSQLMTVATKTCVLDRNHGLFMTDDTHDRLHFSFYFVGYSSDLTHSIFSRRIIFFSWFKDKSFFIKKRGGVW